MLEPPGWLKDGPRISNRLALPRNGLYAMATARRNRRKHTRTGPAIAIENGEADVKKALRDVLFLLKEDLQSRGLQVATDLAHEPVEVLGDRTKLQQVLLNLIMTVLKRRRIFRARSSRSVAGTVRTGTWKSAFPIPARASRRTSSIAFSSRFTPRNRRYRHGPFHLPLHC